jgi:hypothetical protein
VAAAATTGEVINAIHLALARLLAIGLVLWATVSNAFAFSNQISASAAGPSAYVMLLDLRKLAVCNGAGLLLTFDQTVSGTATVQVTGDNACPQTAGECTPGSIYPNSPATHWNNHDTMQFLAGSTNGNISYPVAALRLYVNTYAGTGNITLSVTECDPP